jgi:hypothetical protein
VKPQGTMRAAFCRRTDLVERFSYRFNRCDCAVRRECAVAHRLPRAKHERATTSSFRREQWPVTELAQCSLERRDVGLTVERDPVSSRLLRNRPGALLMHRLESYAGLLDIGGDGVDDSIDPGYGGGDRGLVAHVGAQDRDTVQISRSEDAPRPIGKPDRDAQRRSFGGEPPAEEAGATEPTNSGGVSAITTEREAPRTDLFGAVSVRLCTCFRGLCASLRARVRASMR